MVARHETPFDGEPPLTPSQAAAIASDGHTLLAAGAGSGKTTTLVDKILFALGAERIPGAQPRRLCELHEIAAITFTNAAAADLKQKLRERIRTVAAWYAERGEMEAAAAWRTRSYAVDRARIGTIHSFCGDVLRESALRAGLDPAFRILESADASVLMDECVGDVLARALEERPASMRLAETVGLRKTQSAITGLARQPDLVEQALESWFPERAPRIEELRAQIATSRSEWGCTDDEGEWRGALDELSASLCGELLELARAARGAMVERLDAMSALDFDAMILRTRKMLRDDRSVLEAVRAKLVWLFIDEFQDTDAAQLEIAYRVSGFGDPEARNAPSLCIVGDPKQSIYRFRRADVSLWARVENDFKERGIQTISLDTNFRSVSPIVTYVNATFGELIGSSPEAVFNSGHDVRYARLAAHRTPPINEAVELLVAAGAPEGTGEKMGERRSREAEAVVGRLVELVGREAVIWDDMTQQYRVPRWRDIAVLVRARTPLPALEAAFREHGVPYYLASGDGFFGRREIVDICLLLSALADTRDDVAWLGLLRSPFIGLTDDSILRGRKDRMHAPLSAILRAGGGDADGELFARARTMMDGLAGLRDRITVAELIDHAVEQSAYMAQLLTRPGGELAAMNVRKLIQMAEGRPGDTVSDFVAFVKERKATSAREGDAPLFTAEEDVVTITTVHSAKGLEWPIVFLVDLNRELASAKKPPVVMVDPDAGVALELKARGSDGKNATVPGAWEYMTQHERELSLAEEKRLWYVAATRARDRLILCATPEDVTTAAGLRDGTIDGEAKCVKHWLLGALRPSGDVITYADGAEYRVAQHTPQPHEAPIAVHQPIPSIADIAAAGSTLESELIERIAARPAVITLPRYSATQLKLLDSNPGEYERRYTFGLPERRVYPRTGDRPTPAGVPAAVLGDVLHGALEQERDDADVLSYMEAELSARLDESQASSRVQAATRRLYALFLQCRENPAVARLYDAPGSERELEFTWFTKTAYGHALVRGAIDLVATVEGAAEFLDFKSHRLKAGEEEKTAEDYRVQLQVYTAAYASVTETVPSAFTFFFPETSCPVVKPIDSATVDAGAVRVRTLIDEAIAQGEPR